MSWVHSKLTRVVHELITTIKLAWKLAENVYFFKISLLFLLKKFVISPKIRKKKQIKQKNQHKQCNMTFPRMRVTIVEWRNKNNGRAYSKYLGCEKVKLANVAWKHSCKNVRADGFRLRGSVSVFCYWSTAFQIWSKYLTISYKDLEFSIKFSSVKANCSTLECQGKIKNNNNINNKRTNKKNKMNLFVLQQYTTLNFSITKAVIAWKFNLFVLLNKSITVFKMKFLKGETPVLHIKSVKGIVALNF